MQKRTKILLGSFIGLVVVIVMWSVKDVLFGDRVSGVESAFLEMSPELKSELERYRRECYGNDTCNKEDFFKRRNKIVAEAWPGVYDRLSGFQNWGDGRLTRPYRDEFFRETSGYTAKIFRSDWLPVLQYREGELVLYPCNREDRRRYVPRKVILAGLCK